MLECATMCNSKLQDPLALLVIHNPRGAVIWGSELQVAASILPLQLHLSQFESMSNLSCRCMLGASPFTTTSTLNLCSQPCIPERAGSFQETTSAAPSRACPRAPPIRVALPLPLPLPPPLLTPPSPASMAPASPAWSRGSAVAAAAWSRWKFPCGFPMCCWCSLRLPWRRGW